MADPKPILFKKLLDEDVFSDGQIVNCIEGTITEIYDPTKGQGTKGPWEFQDAYMVDAEGTKMKLSFASNSQSKNIRNKKVRINSVKTAQHGMQGIKIEDRTFKKGDEEHQERRLKITGTAKIEIEGGSTPDGKSASGQASGGSGGGGGYRGPDLTLHPVQQIGENIALHKQVLAGVRMVYTTDEKDETGKLLVNESLLQAAVASVFIESCKQGLAYQFADRASKPFPKKIPPPPADPADWKLCQIPTGDLAGTTLEELSDSNLLDLYNVANTKKKEGPFWACVRRAAKERDVLPKEETQQSDPDLDVADDDIPF